MARKKQEIQLQVELENQEDFDAFIQKPGLIVVDIYQEWCGPCKPIQGQFRKLKIESTDADFLQLAVAKADTIDSLQAYRGKCEPCFLLYAGATLVGAIRGVNPALLTKVIETEIAKEKKVQAGETERQEYVDSVAAPRTGRKGGKAAEEEETVQKEVTIVILKPDLVAAGRVDEAIARLQQLGLEVLEREQRALAEDEVAVLYEEHAEKEYFGELKEYMMSGPCVILAVSRVAGTGTGVAREVHDTLLGPISVEEAREAAPNSLRSLFGSDAFHNGLHAASGHEMAARELAFFFPGFSAPGVTKPKVQRTVAVVRPEAYAKHRDAILAKIQHSGYHVAIQKEMQLSREQAEEYYVSHKEQPYFEQLVSSMISGPLLALALVKEDAVAEWRRQLGPGKTVQEAREANPFTLRAQFDVETTPNALHGATTEEEAKRDEMFFFPPEQTLVAIKPDAVEQKEDIVKAIADAGFSVKSSKDMQLSEEMAKEFYRDQQGKDHYDELVGYMANGNTTFLVIERDDAIMRFREILGSTDPQEAADGTLRKRFGHDILHNAVHGSSNAEHAHRCIDLIFGSDVQQQQEEAKPKEDEKAAEGEKPEEEAAEGEKAAEGEGEGEQKPEEKPAQEAQDDEKPQEGEQEGQQGEKQEQEQQQEEQQQQEQQQEQQEERHDSEEKPADKDEKQDEPPPKEQQEEQQQQEREPEDKPEKVNTPPPEEKQEEQQEQEREREPEDKPEKVATPPPEEKQEEQQEQEREREPEDKPEKVDEPPPEEKQEEQQQQEREPEDKPEEETAPPPEEEQT